MNLAQYIDQQEKWIEKYGSVRLKKAMKADILDQMKGVYESERVKQEFGPNCQPMPKCAENIRYWDDASEEQIDFLLSFDQNLKPSLICFETPALPQSQLVNIQQVAVMLSVPWTDTKIISIFKF